MIELLVALSSYRATRLLARDTFPPLAILRARVSERWGDDSWQAYLATCSWCLGVWVSAAITAATWWVVEDLAVPFLVWGAAAAVTGLLASWETEPEEE